jgi:hypothetical protein
MSPHEWHDHYGPAFDQLEAAKQNLDPHTTLTPGYEVFAQPDG